MSIKKIIASALVLGTFMMPLASCRWMGEKTGQAADEVEEGAEEFEEGYEEGRDS